MKAKTILELLRRILRSRTSLNGSQPRSMAGWPLGSFLNAPENELTLVDLILRTLKSNPSMSVDISSFLTSSMRICKSF